MSLLGEDFRGGWFRRQFNGYTPAGLGAGVAAFAGLLVAFIVLQGLITLIITVVFIGSAFENQTEMARAAVLGLIPLGLAMLPIVWQAARIRGGDPWEVLNLRWPEFTLLGWAVVVSGFVLGIFLMFFAILLGVSLLGFAPETGGLVEQTVQGFSGSPWAYTLVVPSLVIGAPLAEEFLFRGQIFTALSQTRAGFSGATILTSLAWASLHYSGNFLQVALIFVLGLVLGWLLYRFGSIWVTMACHAAWNTVVGLAILGSGGGAA